MRTDFDLAAPRRMTGVFAAAFRFMFREGARLTALTVAFHVLCGIVCVALVLLYVVFLELSYGRKPPGSENVAIAIVIAYPFITIYLIHIITQLFVYRYQTYANQYDEEPPTLWQLAKQAPARFWWSPPLNVLAVFIGLGMAGMPGILAYCFFQYWPILALKGQFSMKEAWRLTKKGWGQQILVAFLFFFGLLVGLIFLGGFAQPIEEAHRAIRSGLRQAVDEIRPESYNSWVNDTVDFLTIMSALLLFHFYWVYFTLVKLILVLKTDGKHDINRLLAEQEWLSSIGAHLDAENAAEEKLRDNS